jgi:hypothetical protein
VLAINCFQQQYKPKRITLACGDGSSLLRHLKWSSWSQSMATAHGVYAVNSCSPSCAAGHFQSYPVSVTLSKPKTCPNRKRKAFGRVSLTFGASRPKHAPSHLAMRCPLPLPPAASS